MRQYALVPVIFIMVGCALLGSGIYMGRIVKYEGYFRILFFVRDGENFDVSSSYAGDNWFYVVKGYGFGMPEEAKVVGVFGYIPKPKDVNLYNIENVIVDIYPENPAGHIWIPDRPSTVDDWQDFTINVGKLKNPEDYLNPYEELWRKWFFNMDIIGQYNTAEHKMSEPYAYFHWVKENLSGASYKFKYENESMVGVGLVMTTTLPYPPYGFWAFFGNLGLRLEGRGLVNLYGYVYDKNKNPMSDVCVSCDYGITYTDEDGYYEINVPEGTVELTYTKNGSFVAKKTVNVPDVERFRVDVTEQALTLDKVLFYSGLAFIILGFLSLVGLAIASRRETGWGW
jgi:hypothetical protein